VFSLAAKELYILSEERDKKDFKTDYPNGNTIKENEKDKKKNVKIRSSNASETKEKKSGGCC